GVGTIVWAEEPNGAVNSRNGTVVLFFQLFLLTASLRAVFFPNMKTTALLLLSLLLACTLFAQPKKSKRSALKNIQPDDCTLSFSGSARKAVKLRTAADGQNYTKVNN